MSVALKRDIAPELNRLFEIYQGLGINDKTRYKELRSAAKQAVNQLTESEIVFLKDGNFRLTLDLFNVAPDAGVTRFEVYAGFSNFIKTLFGIVNNRSTQTPDVKSIERKPLPELSAFDRIGNNDLNISYKPANYTLIYG